MLEGSSVRRAVRHHERAVEGLEFWLHGRLTDDLGASLSLHCRRGDIAASRFPARTRVSRNAQACDRCNNRELGLLPRRCQRPNRVL